MAEYYIGQVNQAIPEAEWLSWRKSEQKPGNDLKFSSISEIDITLDTSRFQFCMPTQGPETYRVDGMQYLVNSGEYFILNPEQHVRAEGIFKKRAEGFCIFLTPDMINEVAHATQFSMDKKLDTPFDFPWQQQAFVIKNYRLVENSFGRFLMNLQAGLLSTSPPPLVDWDAFYYGIVEAFLFAHRKIGQQLAGIKSVRTITKQEIFKRISLAHSFILENFDQPISLDGLARVALFSKYHVVRLYRQIYGLTPYQHLLQVRVEKAKELLLQNYAPTEVAYQLSFSDRRAFAKVFKRFTGVAPSAFLQKGAS